jgi:glycerate kinase
MRRVTGVEVDEAPIADGGEGTAEVLRRAVGGHEQTVRVTGPMGTPVDARWVALDDGSAVVDSAQAVGLPLVDPGERDPLRATTRGLGELLVAVAATRPRALLVGVGGTATVDGGAGMREVVGDALEGLQVEVLCDVRNPLLGERGAARAFGPQKGAGPDAVETLERRLASLDELAPFRELPGAGAGGGLGAAFAALGAQLVGGADRVLDRIGFDRRASGAALVVTGEGTVDATTLEGKGPGAVQRRCRMLGVRCVLVGGLVLDGIDAQALSGDPAHAAADLDALGEELALRLVRGA